MNVDMKTLFDAEKAFGYLKKLAGDLGTRPSGSEKERKAAEYIAAEFKAQAWKPRFRSLN